MKTIKEQLKTLSASITESKRTWKHKPYYDCQEFRHRHIAYCLIRGRTMEQIENVDRNVEPYCYNKPNQKRIDKYIEEYKLALESRKPKAEVTNE